MSEETERGKGEKLLQDNDLNKLLQERALEFGIGFLIPTLEYYRESLTQTRSAKTES